MNAYVDANALVRHYLDVENRHRLVRLLVGEKSAGTWTVPVTDLLQFEVKNAIERMVFETRTGGSARITPEMALVAHGDFDFDLTDSSFVFPVPLSLADIETEFDTLVRRYTAKHGFRTYDIIHVASAKKLGCKRFLSFDKKANALAKLVGLVTL